MTFSILGRCARTGMFGLVVTTSSPAVGSRCGYVAAGVGAALTQNRTDPRLGPLAIDLLKREYTAKQAIAAIVAYRGGLNSFFEKGFYFSNPNASRTCGCGESFSV